MISHSKKKGFTVMELVIVMTLAVVVLGIIWTMFTISNKIISDVIIKSDLQREGQAIQEKLSNSGMQAIGIQPANEDSTSVSGDSTTKEINDIVIDLKDNNGSPYYLKIEKKYLGKTYIDTIKIYELYIDDKLISSNLKSMKVNSEIITNDPNKNAYIQFTIILSKKKTYNNEIINYPIKIMTVFRNKNTAGI